jgi:hypothetical protein
MSKLEDELRQALRHREPPAGFAERAAARARARQTEKRRPRLLTWRWLAPVAALLVLAAGLRFFEERHRRLAGEQAKQQVMLALQLTGSRLRLAQQRIQQVIGAGSVFQN